VDVVFRRKDTMKIEFHVKWGLRGHARTCLQVKPITAPQITSYAMFEKNISIPLKRIKKRMTKENIKRGIYCVLNKQITVQ
jgi:hypothetical protein